MKTVCLAFALLFLTNFSLFAGDVQWPALFTSDSIPPHYSEVDKSLILSSKEQFNTAVHDTTRYLAVYKIVESLNSSDWEMYNEWLLTALEKKLKEDLKTDEKLTYKGAYASTVGNKGLMYSNTGDFNLALEYFNKALKIHKELGSKHNIGAVFNNIGYTYSKMGDVLLALEFYQSALHIREELGDKSSIANSLNNIGYIYERLGDIVKCIDYYERALKLREEAEDVPGIANSFHNIGAVHLEQGDTKKAIEYYNKAKEIREEIGDMQGLALTLNNIGYVHKEAGETEEASEFHKKALGIYIDLGDRPGQVLAMHNLAAVCIDEKDWAGARAYLDEAWNINDALGDPSGTVGLLMLMAQVELRDGNAKIAEEKALTALAIAQKEHYASSIMNLAATLENVYEVTGDWEKRFKYYSLYIELRDSLSNSETQKAAANQSLKYEYEKAESERQKKQAVLDAIAAKEIILQRTIIVGIGIFFLLALVLAWTIWNRLKTTRKQKRLIEKQSRDIKDSIDYAKRIQMAILPSLELIENELNSLVFFLPKDVVAGDFYYYVKKEAVHFFAAADCTGHGVPGAMVSVVCNSALNRAINEYLIDEPAEILNKVRELVLATFANSNHEVMDGMDIALCKYNSITRVITFAGAQNPLYHITTIDKEMGDKTINNGTHMVKEYKGDKQPIGKFARQFPFTQQEIQLETGDTIFISSDGYADQFGGPKGRKFMYKPFKKLLLDIHQKPLTEQKTLLKNHFDEWKGEMDQIDDVCIIGMKV